MGTLCVLDHSFGARIHSLRDGGQTDRRSFGCATGIHPLLSVSLASGIGSLRPVHEAWRGETLTQSMLTDILGCDNFYKYSSDSGCIVFFIVFFSAIELELSLAGG